MKSNKNSSHSFRASVTRSINGEKITINETEMDREDIESVKAAIEELKNNLKAEREAFKASLKESVRNQKNSIKASTQNIGGSIAASKQSIQETLEEIQEEEE